MIIITGAAGFIGSCMAAWLNKSGYTDLILVDDFERADKRNNYKGIIHTSRVNRKGLFDWVEENHIRIQFIIHLGARTDTTLEDENIFNELNLLYTQKVWNLCVKYGLPLIYASSAATYGAGEFGYSDNESKISELKPLNKYGESKNNFDIWALKQDKKPWFWAGFKFFNVYGPNEYHKGRMASVVFHAYKQLCQSGKIKLFRSHKEGIKDGGQMRDFVYVKDVCRVLHWFMENRPQSGLYNLGSGKAGSFNELAEATCQSSGYKCQIEFIDTPADIREKYQYFTEADLGRLRAAGYLAEFTSLKDGVSDYLKNYLIPNKFIQE